MLVIRMQRTGRKGHAQFRIVVQDVRQTPTSGNIVASLGSYDPHTKQINIDTEKAKFYLKNGAQPSARVAAILKKQAIKLPSWTSASAKQTKAKRHPEKLRKNQPVSPKSAVKEPSEPVSTETPDSLSADKEAVSEAVVSGDEPITETNKVADK